MAPLFGLVTYIIKELFLCLKVHPMGESKILQITYRLRLSAIFFYSHELFRINIGEVELISPLPLWIK